MRFNYFYLALFFLTVALGALALFPTSLDIVSIYRNSYLYRTALESLDALEAEHPADPRVALERSRVLFLSGQYEAATDLLLETTRRQPDLTAAWRQLAETYRAQQRHRDAMATLEHLLVAAPGDSQALYLLDEYYSWFQEPERAEANLRSLLRYFPNDQHKYGALVDLLLRTGDGDGAVTVLRRMAGAFPDSLDMQQYLGEVLLARRDSAAVEVFARLHERQPQRRDIFDQLCAALIVSGRREEVLRRFEQYYAGLLPPVSYHQQLSRLFVYLSDRPRAIAQLEKAEALRPSPGIWRELLELNALQKDYGRATHYAARLVRADPENSEYRRLHVAYLATAGRRQDLVRALEEFVEKWPEDTGMWVELGDAYDWVEDYRSELRVARRLAAAEPGEEAHRARLARVLAALGRPSQAAAIYAQLLRRNRASDTYRLGLLQAVTDAPGDRRALGWARQVYGLSGPGSAAATFLLADQLRRADRAGAAEDVLADLIGESRADADLEARVGQWLAEAGRIAAAQPYFRRALELDPDQSAALSGLAGLRVTEAPLEAAELLERLAALRPRDEDVAYRAGLAHAAAGDSLAATPHFRRVVALTERRRPATAYAVQRRAHALWRTGRVEEALPLLAAARHAYADDGSLATDYAELLIAEGSYDEALSALEEIPPP